MSLTKKIVRVTISSSNPDLLEKWKNELISRGHWDGLNPPDYRDVKIPIDEYFDMVEKTE